MLTNCTVGPDFKTPEAPAIGGYLPTSARAPQAADKAADRRISIGADVPAAWWELFRAPTLDRLVAEGIAHNADLRAAEAAIRAAQANALAQRGLLFPTVDASFNATRQMVPTQVVQSDVASGASLFSLHTAQVSVAFTPDVFGGVRRALESAEAHTEMQAFQREGVYLTLTSNIALAAIQEASLRGQIDATRTLISQQSQLLDILRHQNERGQIALPDVLAQETALAQVRLTLPALERQLGQQRNLLATLTGRLPQNGLPETFQLRSFRNPHSLPLSLPADLVRQRPDVRAAEANLRAVNAQIGVALANRLPQITLAATTGSNSEAIKNLFSPGTGLWTIAGNVAQTVFDAGTRAFRQQEAEELTAQATEQYRATVLTAFQNVADVLYALRADGRAIAAASAAEDSARRNIEVVRRQVEQGQVSSPVLINAQQAYLQTMLAGVQARASRLANTVALFQALGGGWWSRGDSAPAVITASQ